MKVTKESLIDWYVTDASGRVQARIEKSSGKGLDFAGGYYVYLRLFNFAGPYFFRTFKEAKACAVDPINHPN